MRTPADKDSEGRRGRGHGPSETRDRGPGVPVRPGSLARARSGASRSSRPVAGPSGTAPDPSISISSGRWRRRGEFSPAFGPVTSPVSRSRRGARGRSNGPSDARRWRVASSASARGKERPAFRRSPVASDFRLSQESFRIVGRRGSIAHVGVLPWSDRLRVDRWDRKRFGRAVARFGTRSRGKEGPVRRVSPAHSARAQRGLRRGVRSRAMPRATPGAIAR